uniref:ATP synthase F0 subunit 8 n=1 Tax=Cirrothauma murrayi TaxID=61702 RepID=UPI0022FD4C30|nr:ATP synthase F0 subunit 8 [Cirrothauma murrayi]WAP91401.1 ATP synthase F0 subunit 8 [Cirrothauma murrayi]
MPQLSPLNWTLLFLFFWLIMTMNSSSMWWSNKNLYKINLIKNNKNILIKYNW